MTGNFVETDYLADNYQDHYGIRVRQATLDLTINGTQNQTGGQQYADLSPIKISGSRKAARKFTRRIRIGEIDNAGDPILGRALIWLPWLRPDGFDGFVPGLIGTYKGNPIEVVQKQNEKIV